MTEGFAAVRNVEQADLVRILVLAPPDNTLPPPCSRVPIRHCDAESGRSGGSRRDGDTRVRRSNHPVPGASFQTAAPTRAGRPGPPNVRTADKQSTAPPDAAPDRSRAPRRRARARGLCASAANASGEPRCRFRENWSSSTINASMPRGGLAQWSNAPIPRCTQRVGEPPAGSVECRILLEPRGAIPRAVAGKPEVQHVIRLDHAKARSSTRTECIASRPARSRIWCRQEVPSATIRSSGAAPRTAGSSDASAIARDTSCVSAW